MAATPNFTLATSSPYITGDTDDGFYTIELPWDINFVGFTVNKIYVGTNSYITVGGGSTQFNNLAANNPPFRKLAIGARDNVLLDFTYSVQGTSPNRTAYIKYSGYQYGGYAGYASLEWEVTFFENANGIDKNADILVNIILNYNATNSTGLNGLFTASTLLCNILQNPGEQFTIRMALDGSSATILPRRTLTIAGDSSNFGTGQGVMMIAKYETPTTALGDPQSYVSDLYFHSGLPYVQITKNLPELPNNQLTFPAVPRGVHTWDDGGGDKKIICTKLYKLGLMSKEIYLADQAFGEQLLKSNPDVYNGYRAWAEIVVDWMEGRGPKMMPWMTDEQFSKIAKYWSTSWAQDIATPWAEQMAYKMGAKDSGNLTGKLIIAAGTPICKIVGVWQRVFGSSKKPAGFGKGLMLIPVFVMFKTIVKLGKLIDNKKSESK